MKFCLGVLAAEQEPYLPVFGGGRSIHCLRALKSWIALE